MLELKPAQTTLALKWSRALPYSVGRGKKKKSPLFSLGAVVRQRRLDWGHLEI